LNRQEKLLRRHKKSKSSRSMPA